MLVIGMHGNLMVAAGQVQSRKELGPDQRIKRLLDPRKRIGITNCLRIEPAIVDAEADSPVFLADDDHWCSIRTVALDDDILCQRTLDVLLDLLQLVWRYASVRLGHRNGVCGAESMVDGFCVAQVLLVLDEASSMLCQQFLQVVSVGCLSRRSQGRERGLRVPNQLNGRQSLLTPPVH